MPTSPIAAVSFRIAFTLALAIAVVNGFARFAYALILPAMRDALAWDYAASGWLNTANSVGYALGGLSGLLLLSRIRPSRLFVWGLLATVVCIALVGWTHDLALMLVWRLLAGIGSAWVFACGGALVAARYSHDPKASGTAIAIFYAGGGLGIALSGLVVFPVLSGGMSWQVAWYTLGAAALLLSLLPVLVARTLEARLPIAENPAPANTANAANSAKAVSAVARFPWRRFPVILLAYFLFGVGYIVYLTFVIAWLKEMRVSVLVSAGLWVVMGLAAMASGWIWRRPMSQWLPTRTYTAAALCTAFGSGIPVFFRSEPALLLSVLMVGGSFFMVPASMAALSRKTLEQSLWAKAMNVFTMVFAVGQGIGPVLAGWLADSAGLDRAMLMGALILLLSAALARFQHAPDFNTSRTA